MQKAAKKLSTAAISSVGTGPSATVRGADLASDTIWSGGELVLVVVLRMGCRHTIGRVGLSRPRDVVDVRDVVDDVLVEDVLVERVRDVVHDVLVEDVLDVNVRDVVERMLVVEVVEQVADPSGRDAIGLQATPPVQRVSMWMATWHQAGTVVLNTL